MGERERREGWGERREGGEREERERWEGRQVANRNYII